MVVHGDGGEVIMTGMETDSKSQEPAPTGAAVPPRPPVQNWALKTLEHLGAGTDVEAQIYEMIGHSKFFSDFTRSDIRLLAGEMQVYRAQPGQTIIREGDIDDYMMLMVGGRVEIMKKDRNASMQPMTAVGPGATLGEMSMIDGEPRFATCTAQELTIFAVLSRDAMVRILLEEPSLGAKILIKLVTLLSARLRVTSSNLLHYMER